MRQNKCFWHFCFSINIEVNPAVHRQMAPVRSGHHCLENVVDSKVRGTPFPCGVFWFFFGRVWILKKMLLICIHTILLNLKLFFFSYALDRLKWRLCPIGEKQTWETNEQTHMITGRKVEMGNAFTLCLSLVSPSFTNVCFCHIQGNFPDQSLLSGQHGSVSHPALFLGPSHAPCKETVRRWAINLWEKNCRLASGRPSLEHPRGAGDLV